MVFEGSSLKYQQISILRFFFSIKLLDHILINRFFVNFNASEDVTNYTVSCETV
jgi:hypothetical protein